ncbi:MAG: nuclear transport factor 2 family protein [Desmonostoc vinosum HA7617-LM4]|jgi:hypothetical protein|nr:nuclear transport factor 2 family protein [Desmonostoc vinosum HA7617-LM4]
MKKNNIALTALLTASIFINADIAKADTQSDRQEIIRKYHWMSDGCNAKVIQQCYAYWSVNFQGRRADGTITNLREQIQGRQQFFQQVSQYKTREELIRVSVNGNRADVMGLGYSDYIIGNKRVHRQTPYEDIWEKTNNDWVLVSTRWYKANYNEVAIGRSPTQTAPLPPSTSISEQFNFVWQMPKFWNP